MPVAQSNSEYWRVLLERHLGLKTAKAKGRPTSTALIN